MKGSKPFLANENPTDFDTSGVGVVSETENLSWLESILNTDFQIAACSFKDSFSAILINAICKVF